MTIAAQIAELAEQLRSPERDRDLAMLLLGLSRTAEGELRCSDDSLIEPVLVDHVRSRLLEATKAPPEVKRPPPRVIQPIWQIPPESVTGEAEA